jgi:DNA (cytosine-5)-methyltransferase 1
MQIPVVDIFAGPGGLGEGFSAFAPRFDHKKAPFRIAISAEMEKNAARTLRLRSFFRQFASGEVPDSYYQYVAGRADLPWTKATERQWEAAGDEARQLQLGVAADDAQLHSRISEISRTGNPWVLIGGPPCQAYSLVGRSRNAGIRGYRPEADHRHFLYAHYLTILRKFRPAAFVMENVKGILSSEVGGELMFPKILEDLRSPGGKNGPKYRVIPLIRWAESGLEEDSRRYVLRAEELGVPQARHRVVLLGLADDIDMDRGKYLSSRSDRFGVSDVIGGLPRLRSGLTDRTFDKWSDFALELLEQTEAASDDEHVSRLLSKLSRGMPKRDPGSGGKRVPASDSISLVPEHLKSWLLDPRLDVILNHEVRGHMSGDLMRYAYAAAFARVYGRSPKGAAEFPRALHPKHKNWRSGKFADRFKVQIADAPSSTVTSHLSKDGHYFIHSDPTQLRSLSVREAARLQTFPDNYFFEGSRGAQFKQVGNAVPPWMARQIAEVVYSFVGR